MKQNNRIYMIGFMGAGKSVVGEKLAEALGYQFLDLDTEFEKQAIISIKEYFLRIGEAEFRLTEAELLRKLYYPDMVLATGGGTPCFHNNMKWMNDYGLTVYLQQSPDALFNRLKDQTSERPLLKGLDGSSLKKYIEEQLGKRESFYTKANIIIDGNGKSVDEQIAEIRQRI